jgi:hypothetical protein
MLRIDELTLRIPGLSEDDGHRLGKAVASRLSARWPGSLATRQFDELNVQLIAPPNATTDQLAEAIVSQLLKQIAV